MIRLSSAETETTPEAASPPTDPVRETLLAEIAGPLGDDLLESHIEVGHELVIRIPAEAWKRTLKTLRDDFGFKFFEFLAGIDWMPSPYGKSEDASADAGVPVTTVANPGQTETGVAGGDTRFQIFARLIKISPHAGGSTTMAVTIKADIPEQPDGSMGSVETVIGVFPGANWHERETHEMYGIGFDGHPYLEALYLPSGFEGHPLRKDFPLLARHVKPWPGIVDVEPMPDGDDDDSEEDDS